MTAGCCTGIPTHMPALMLRTAQWTWPRNLPPLPRMLMLMLMLMPLPSPHHRRLLPHNDAPETLDFLGPFTVGPDNTVQGLPQPFDPAQYFYCYACKKNPLELSKSKGELQVVHLCDMHACQAPAMLLGIGLPAGDELVPA